MDFIVLVLQRVATVAPRPVVCMNRRGTVADCIMIIFVTVVIGRCWSDSVRRRSWLGLAGVLLVVAAGLAAYGVNSAFGKGSR